MLQLMVPGREYYDEAKQEFITFAGTTLQLEHSLISISKWEAKWKKPFLKVNDGQERTFEESKDYVRCMTLNTNVPSDVYDRLTKIEFDKISEYIDDKMTATWFNDKGPNGMNSSRPGGRSQTITSELIYYWMIEFGIPFECQKWHLNRLLTLIRVCEIKNSPGKKMSRNDIFSQNRALNAARKKRLGTRG